MPKAAAPADPGPAEEPEPLKPGDGVAHWKIVTLLGAGAFGEVYTVEKNGKQFAMKTERFDLKARVLKMEVVVLKALEKSNAQHSCRILDTGRTKSFCYIVMTLVGKSLLELRKSTEKGHLTMGCAISVGMQCLEAIQELHIVGYLHRGSSENAAGQKICSDLKPANYAVSLEDPRRIYILDFGMCRKYVDDHNRIRMPREFAGFRGTLRYAPIGCHSGIESSRKDDLESWFYQLMELTNGSLPWSHLVDYEDVHNMKEDFRKRAERLEMLGGCPKEYVYMIDYIDNLTYCEDPSYASLRGLLRDALRINKLKEFPYDWETAKKN